MTRATASFPQEYYTSELSPLTSALAQDGNNRADEGVRDIHQPPQASCLLLLMLRSFILAGLSPTRDIFSPF